MPLLCSLETRPVVIVEQRPLSTGPPRTSQMLMRFRSSSEMATWAETNPWARRPRRRADAAPGIEFRAAGRGARVQDRHRLGVVEAAGLEVPGPQQTAGERRLVERGRVVPQEPKRAAPRVEGRAGQVVADQLQESAEGGGVRGRVGAERRRAAGRGGAGRGGADGRRARRRRAGRRQDARVDVVVAARRRVGVVGAVVTTVAVVGMGPAAQDGACVRGSRAGAAAQAEDDGLRQPHGALVVVLEPRQRLHCEVYDV